MEELTEQLKSALFPKNLILCGYRGSVAQNTFVPNTDPNSIDDIDLMGVYLAPSRYYVGLGRGRKYRKAVERFIDCWDVVSYELKKYVNLLLKSNPNVLSLLWLENQFYLPIEDQLHKTWGEELVKNREAFVSKNAFASFTGYARGQLKRMTHLEKRGYMGDKRKKLVEKFGYDTKNASHLIRLLKMAVEYLDSGKLIVYRKDDAQTLIDIKVGGWALKDVQEEAEFWFAKVEEAYKKSPLPEHANIEKVEEIMMDIVLSHVHRESTKT